MNKNNLLSNLETYIQKKGLITDGATLIVGLSGGPDSVFLLHFLAQLRDKKNLRLIVAHLDHEWRAASKQDAQFCKELAATYNLEFICKTISDLNLNIKFNGSKEELGRKARRTFFESLAKEYNATGIVLAHHADDQMETFFIRMVRGASLSGLAGMKAKDGLYIRPLLEIKKDEILAYLKEHNHTFVIDDSNSSDEFLRNRIRNTVIPALRSVDERFDNRFEHTHAQLQEAHEFLEAITATLIKEIIDDSGSLSISQLDSLHSVVKNRILIEWLCAHKVPFIPSKGLLEELLRFLHQNNDGTHLFYNKWMVIKKGAHARIVTI
jgi:tRNA(Ile)-lysidine synthase